jgi:hypothetical protein
MAVDPNNIPGVTASPPAAGVSVSTPYWNVYYTTGLNSVESRLDVNPQIGQNAAVITVQAATEAEAETDAERIIGTNGSISNVTGPFTSKTTANTDITNTKTSIAKQSQAGSLPSISFSDPLDFLGEIGDFFSRLTQLNTWIRIGKVLFGGALVVIGLAHITGADNAVATAARNVKVLPV